MTRAKFTYLLFLILCFNSLKGTGQSINPDSLRAVILPTIPSGTFDVTSYGAVSSQTTDNTSSIQKAIDAASAAGGGTVVIPTGTFLSGPLTMKSNINLNLSCGTTLRMLPYGPYPGSGSEGDRTPLINCNGINNVEISGWGTIDGQGQGWWAAYLASKADPNIPDVGRPTVIGLTGCNYIEISGITILNAPNTNIGIGKNCSHATVFGVTITAPETSPNTDGINVWSPFINIINCTISNGDDNVAMNGNCSYIKIVGCKFGTGHGCSIGSYATNVNHVTVDRCTFNGTTTGIRMKSARGRGGLNRYLTYTNITMTNVSTAIGIASYYPDIPADFTDPAQVINSTTPYWKDIVLKNITITGSGEAGNLWGLPELSITNIVFDNVKISAAKGMTANYVSSALFKNGSKITVTSGNAFVSTHNATISGINTTTGQPL